MFVCVTTASADDSENSMFTAFDNHDDPTNTEQLEHTSSNEEPSVALESMAEPVHVGSRPETTLGISDTFHSQDADKDELDGSEGLGFTSGL